MLRRLYELLHMHWKGSISNGQYYKYEEESHCQTDRQASNQRTAILRMKFTQEEAFNPFSVS